MGSVFLFEACADQPVGLQPAERTKINPIIMSLSDCTSTDHQPELIPYVPVRRPTCLEQLPPGLASRAPIASVATRGCDGADTPASPAPRHRLPAASAEALALRQPAGRVRKRHPVHALTGRCASRQTSSSIVSGAHPLRPAGCPGTAGCPATGAVRRCCAANPGPARSRATLHSDVKLV